MDRSYSNMYYNKGILYTITPFELSESSKQ